MNPAFNNLTSAIEKLGFDGVLYSFFPKPLYLSESAQPLLHYSEKLAPFVSHYLQNNYGNRDFVLRLALEGYRDSIDWWQEIDAGNVSPDEKVVTQDAKNKFGIHHGLSIPILFGTYAISGISVISMDDDREAFKQKKRKTLAELQHSANQYHNHIIQSKTELLFFVAPLCDNLSDTKKKVIKHLLSGLPMKSIPQTFGISQRYAEKTLTTIRKEFGDISTNELLYILGLLNIHEKL